LRSPEEREIAEQVVDEMLTWANAGCPKMRLAQVINGTIRMGSRIIPEASTRVVALGLIGLGIGVEAARPRQSPVQETTRSLKFRAPGRRGDVAPCIPNEGFSLSGEQQKAHIAIG